MLALHTSVEEVIPSLYARSYAPISSSLTSHDVLMILPDNIVFVLYVHVVVVVACVPHIPS